ncbi:uncharacterized protein LOC134532896 [Bacillus rossius redtenbacheri]|uniref:uncharacterized protein LOC134532896 n=1 Tax=Bacillus rossius redtenbacheri TaxID=93214 RepID=UPI002FDCC2E7
MDAAGSGGGQAPDGDRTVISVSVGDCEPPGGCGEGSDSGVELNGGPESFVAFRRGLSVNSGGYASSCGGLDDSSATPAQSCDSSLISYSTCEDAEDVPTSSTLVLPAGGDGTGSESSSVAGGGKRRAEPSGAQKPAAAGKGPAARARAPGVSPRTAAGATTRRDKVSPAPSRSAGGSRAPVTRAAVPKAAADSSGAAARRRAQAAGDDGRWPSTARSRPAPTRPRGGSVESQPARPAVSSTTSSGGAGAMESKSSALDKYATLPRRGRRQSPDPPARGLSVSRDSSLNRAASLRRQHVAGGAARSLPPYPRRRSHQRTRIFHETGVQTALTGRDVEQALAGVGIRERTPLREPALDRDVQVDLRDEEIERLESRLKELGKTHAQLELDFQRQGGELGVVQEKLSEEKEGRLGEKARLEDIEHRLGVVLCSVKGSHYTAELSRSNYLQELENHILSSSNIIVKQQREINELQARCRTLQRDLEKSLAAQKMLLQQQQENDFESMELQDFLQAEKSTLSEALREAEVEITHQKQLVQQRKNDLEQQQEECKHLVRISEQRRQENLALQARLGSLERRSRDLLLQQGAAVSGAAVALSGLGSRLESLVDQLVASYDISDKDLEDVIFHNEAYSKSNSSVEASPEKSSSSRTSEPKCSSHQLLSPKRGSSFVTAVISAIQSSFTDKLLVCPNNREQESSIPTQTDSSPDGDDLLELERDPCAAASEEEEAEEEGGPGLGLADRESLHNLSRAIASRQRCERGGGERGVPGAGLLSPAEDFLPTLTLVDQVIDVDNLVTKLLKVLRIVQLESDSCVEELRDERTQLAERARREQEAARGWEDLGARLRGELQEARQQLQLRVLDLEETRAQLHAHRQLVESLSQDINKMKSTQQNAELQLRQREQEAESALELWQRTGELPSPDVLARIITAKDEIPALKERLQAKDQELRELGQRLSASKQMLTENWHQAEMEVRRQYEAIDAALETLHSIQSVVVQCPPLARLQRDLEEANFHCASSVPIAAPDLNANAPLAGLGGMHNGSTGLAHKHTINGTV